MLAVYVHDMGWGWAVLMMLGWLTLIALLVGVVVAGVRDRRAPSARDVLDRRLAAGEISLDDYEQARAAMSPTGAEHAPTGPPAAV